MFVVSCLFVVGGWWLVVRCSLFVVGCLLFVVNGLVVCCLLLFVLRCVVLFDVVAVFHGSLSVAC